MECAGWSNFTRSLINYNETVVMTGKIELSIDREPVKMIHDLLIMIGSKIYNLSTSKFYTIEFDHFKTFGFNGNIISFNNDKITVYNQDLIVQFTRYIHIPDQVRIYKAFIINQSIFYLTDNILFFNGIVKKNGPIINKAIIRFNGENYNHQFSLSKHGLVFLILKDQKINISLYSFMGIGLSDSVLPIMDNPEEIILECPYNSDYAIIKTKHQTLVWSLVFNRQIGFENQVESIIRGGSSFESFVFYKNNSLCLCNGNSQKIINIVPKSNIIVYPKDSIISGSNILNTD